VSMFLVLLGPPGAGKGTQARLLAQELKLPHVASGDLFRGAFRAVTPLGLKAQEYIRLGELVPDEVTIGMVAERLARSDCAEGVVLDGFPRTVEQAEALGRILAQRGACVALVAFIRVCTETLLLRLGGRSTCVSCQAVYHVLYNPPRRPGRCDACAGQLYQRPDDMPSAHSKRMQVYLNRTAPLVEYYQERRILTTVDGEQDIEAVQRQLLELAGRAMRTQQQPCEWFSADA